MSIETHRSIDGKTIHAISVERATPDQRAAWDAIEERLWQERRRIAADFAAKVRAIQRGDLP